MDKSDLFWSLCVLLLGLFLGIVVGIEVGESRAKQGIYCMAAMNDADRCQKVIGVD